jgi:RimJ/RimL family protein N-acetyltransferase
MDILVTRRLTLRPPLDVDAEPIATALQNTDVARMLTNVPNPYGIEDAVKFIKRSGKDSGSSYFSIYHQRFMGVISVRINRDGEADLGYWLERSAWGQGFMNEAARAVVSHAFRKYGYECIQSGAYQDNRASIAVLQKLGFEPDGEQVHFNETRNCEVTCSRMVLTRQRFQNLFGSLETSAAA